MFYLRRILFLALLLAAFSFAACGDEESGNENSLNISEPGDSDADGDGDADPDPDGDTDPDPDGDIDPDPDGDTDPDPDPDGDTDPDPDPVTCESNDDCTEDGEYCDRPPGCDLAGTCEPIPQTGCGDAITSYCDCDGVLQSSPDTCVWEPTQDLANCENNNKEGCEFNSDCEVAGEYCDREPGCGERGECREIPNDMMCLMVITPYCDCEGNQQQSSNSCIYEPYMEEGYCSM